MYGVSESSSLPFSSQAKLHRQYHLHSLRTSEAYFYNQRQYLRRSELHDRLLLLILRLVSSCQNPAVHRVTGKWFPEPGKDARTINQFSPSKASVIM